jgi:hypothetical protein
MATREMVETVGQVLSVLRQMTANAPKSLPPDVLMMWAGVMESSGLSPEDVRKAASQHLATKTFFPSPADLITIARPPINADLVAEDAWLKARRCVERYGYYGSLTADDLGGDTAALWALEKVGWERLCSEMEEGNRAIFRAEFVRYYRLAVEMRYELHHVAGAHERLNRANGYDLTPGRCGRNDWAALPDVVTGKPQPMALPEPVEEAA